MLGSVDQKKSSHRRMVALNPAGPLEYSDNAPAHSIWRAARWKSWCHEEVWEPWSEERLLTLCESELLEWWYTTLLALPMSLYKSVLC